jgi:hypothetical protein
MKIAIKAAILGACLITSSVFVSCCKLKVNGSCLPRQVPIGQRLQGEIAMPPDGCQNSTQQTESVVQDENAVQNENAVENK